MAEEVDVLVVGAGPVGLALAIELTRYGIKNRLIDKSPARSRYSKALVIWSRSLELMGAMGCAEALLAAGLKVEHANIFARARQLARIGFDMIPSQYPYGLFIPQSETERLLEAHLISLGGRVERQVELAGLEQDEAGVAVDLALPEGARAGLRAKWLIGCDGAHSTVRHKLDLAFAGETEQSDWLLADLYLDGTAVASDEISLFWHPEGVLAIFPIGPGRFRVIADLGPARDAGLRPAPTLEEVEKVLERRGPGDVMARDPVWLSSFRINERKVRDYRAGRVFLAGDAAHIHSPAGGQGMNTGIQDACGLAWRLALVCRGQAGDGVLLDSYSLERSAVGDHVLRNAGRLTRLAIMRNHLAQALRNEAVSLLARLAPVRRRFALAMSELDISYPASPLSRYGKGAPLQGALGRPGERAPDISLQRPDGQPTSLH